MESPHLPLLPQAKYQGPRYRLSLMRQDAMRGASSKARIGTIPIATRSTLAACTKTAEAPITPPAILRLPCRRWWRRRGRARQPSNMTSPYLYRSPRVCVVGSAIRSVPLCEVCCKMDGVHLQLQQFHSQAAAPDQGQRASGAPRLAFAFGTRALMRPRWSLRLGLVGSWAQFGGLVATSCAMLLSDAKIKPQSQGCRELGVVKGGCYSEQFAE
jgi:hypothetical protein|mmetsp:Transcript_37109/g.61824  ORF Transcript_37109/g.61824 Transcript_37109/m.61824 type:complete len:214 (+) Transcript_37109:84-725(+)